ncbi:MAG TPA: nucleotidyltransferase family protein [Actinomycetes bacterium]|nr:nucleotidyltransferase family protein [Actinomycetes bacterium]
MTAVVGLVLAAGAGRRFGGPKAVVELAGERLVDRAVRVLADGGVSQAYVVSGSVALTVAGAVVVENPDWESGMASSLRAGFDALPTEAMAALVLLVDHVGLTPAAVRRVAGEVTGPASLVAATYDGRLGHPVVLGRDWWPEVRATAAGDQGARAVLAAHRDVLVQAECSDVASAADVDRPGDLTTYREGRHP